MTRRIARAAALGPALLLAIAWSSPRPVVAGGLELEGSKRILLSDASGASRLDIGEVTFVPDGDGYRFEIALDGTRFRDHFLSMRPFTCLEGDTQYLCHLPYPYDKTRQVAKGDFADLEHELLFIHKQPTEYGINMWNGVYYVIEATEGGLRGKLHEVDMDILASPPEDSGSYPLAAAEKYGGEPDSHLRPLLIIE